MPFADFPVFPAEPIQRVTMGSQFPQYSDIFMLNRDDCALACKRLHRTNRESEPYSSDCKRTRPASFALYSQNQPTSCIQVFSISLICAYRSALPVTVTLHCEKFISTWIAPGTASSVALNRGVMTNRVPAPRVAACSWFSPESCHAWLRACRSRAICRPPPAPCRRGDWG